MEDRFPVVFCEAAQHGPDRVARPQLAEQIRRVDRRPPFSGRGLQGKLFVVQQSHEGRDHGRAGGEDPLAQACGYLFARFDLESMLEKVSCTPAVKMVLRFGGRVPEIPDAVIEELQERHNWLTVPASVFGSRRADCSVITCLYYPEEGERDRAAP